MKKSSKGRKRELYELVSIGRKYWTFRNVETGEEIKVPEEKLDFCPSNGVKKRRVWIPPS